MRVALVIDDLSLGGAERVVQRLALGLTQRGHVAHVICLKPVGAEAAALEAAGVGVHSLRSPRRDALVWTRVGAIIARHRIELVHAHSSAALVAAWPACKWHNCPIAMTRHGALVGPPSVYRRVADRLTPFVDQVVLVAESLRADLPAHADRVRARFVPNGIDVTRLSREAARRRLVAHCRRDFRGPVILSVGTISPEKDTLSALEAFARVAPVLPDATLVLIGRARGTEYHRAVDARVRALGLESRVLRTGPVDDAWQIMAGADVFLSSSRTEAMPLAILEAMSQHVPIVATAVGDVGTLDRTACVTHPTLLRHRESALLAPAGDARALAEGVLESLRNPAAAAERCDRAGAAFAAKYTASQMVAAHERLYATLLNRTRRQRIGAARRLPARPNRILMVGPPIGEIGGINSVIDSLSAALRRHGHEIGRFGWPASVALAPRRRRSLVGRIARQLNSLLGLARAVRNTRSHIVHLHTSSGVSFLRSTLDQIVCRALGANTVLHIHGGRFGEFCRGANAIMRAIIRWSCETAARVVMLSDAAAGTLRRVATRATIEVIPNGVEMLTRTPAQSADPACRFLFLGELRLAKGVAELLDAARQLAGRGTRFSLTLAGPVAASERIDWNSEIRLRGLHDRVRWIGPVRGDDKQSAFRAADCLVLPSHIEAMPMVLLEAAAAGLAIVATNVGSIPTLVGEELQREILVPPRSVGALTDCLARVAENPGFRHGVATRLAHRVRARFDLELVTRRTEAVYERIQREPRGTRIDEHIAGRIVYPLHEALRGRPTRSKLQSLTWMCRLPAAAFERAVHERLESLLAFARTTLPFYRRRMELLHSARSSAHALEQLPVLGKPEIRAAAGELVWRGVPGGLLPMTSGGTSGDTLHFHVDRTRIAEDHAARLFMQGLFGVRTGDRRVYLWGSPIEGRPSYARRVRDRLIGELMLDAFDLSDEALDRRLVEIIRFQPRVLYGYPSAVARLAKRAARSRRPADFASLRVVVLTGEEITAEQRSIVSKAFGAPVASEYGNREVGLIAHECPAGSLHVVAPHIHVEILTSDGPADPGAVGSVVCTTLNLRGQPFIRYRVGDVGRLMPHGCECGLPFPVMRLEGGKITGLMALPGGRYCHGAVSSYALRGLAGIVAFRTHQRRIDHIDVLLEVDDTFDPASTRQICERYRRLFGPSVRVDCRIVDRIPPDPSGKRRHFISDVAASHDLSGAIENVESVLVD